MDFFIELLVMVKQLSAQEFVAFLFFLIYMYMSPDLIIIFSCIISLVWGLKCKATLPFFVQFLELVKVHSQL